MHRKTVPDSCPTGHRRHWLPKERLIVICITMALIIGLYVFIKFTKAGLAMRAVADDLTAASLQGMNVDRISSLAFFIGSVLAATTGCLTGPIFYVSPSMGAAPGLMAFVVIILGGIGSITFAIATLALNELFRLIWVEWDKTFGGPAGILNIPSPEAILGIRFGSVVSFYYIAVLLMFAITVVILRIERSRIGLIFSSIREFDTLAASLGVHLMREKVKAFMIASFFAGMAGALFAHLQHFISPVDFTFPPLSMLSAVFKSRPVVRSRLTAKPAARLPPPSPNWWVSSTCRRKKSRC